MITLRGVLLRAELSFEYLGSGRSRGEARGHAPLFLDQSEARRAEKEVFWRPPPPAPSQGLGQALSGGDLLQTRVSEKKKVVRLVRDYKSYHCSCASEWEIAY